HGGPLGDRDDDRDPRRFGLQNGVATKWRRNENHRRIRLRFAHGLFDRVEHRKAVDLRSSFAGSDAADQLGAVLAALLTVKQPGLSGDALAYDARVSVDEDAH